MQEEKRPLKVFLCHANSDKNAVRDLYQRLTKDNVDAWLDKEKLLPGQDWEYEIRKAVREADVVVVCLSKQFNQAGFRQKEVRLALDTAMEKPEGEIFIIPARLEECDTLESLRKWHWADLFGDAGYSNLVKSLNERAKKLQHVEVISSKKAQEPLNKSKQEDLQKISLNIGGNVNESAIVIGSNNVVQIQSGKPRKVSEQEIEEARTKYIEALIRQTEYIDQRGKGLSRSIQLKLDEVYVSLTAERDIGHRDVDRFKEFRRDEDDPNLDEEFSSRRDMAERHVEIVDLARAVRENERLVILGDPGSGKTTLTRFLALLFAGQSEIQGQVNDSENNIYGPPQLPILFRIAIFVEAFSQDHKLSLRECILKNIANEVGAKDYVVRAVLEQALDERKALILLDGLDEIVADSDRAEIGRRIEQFVAGHSGNRFVITSRMTGYHELPLTGNFAHFTLREMEREQIEKFLHRWWPAVENLQPPSVPNREIEKRIKAEIDGILKSVDENPSIQRLASNPLMLTILVLIFREEHRLTSRRADLYDHAVNILLKDWHQARGGKHSLKDYEVINVLAPLAYWMHKNRPSGLAREDELKDEIAKSLAEGYDREPSKFEIQERSDDFFARLIGTGMLVNFSEKYYGFIHLTFEEYLTAREIVRRKGETVQLIYQHRQDPHWQESILLAVAHVSIDYPNEASELIQTAILTEGDRAGILGFKSSPHEDRLHRDLLFALKCLGSSRKVKGQFYEDILSRFLNILVDEWEGDCWPLLRRIEKVLKSLTGTETAKDLQKLLSQLLNEQNKLGRTNAAKLLGLLGNVENGILNSLIENVDDEDSVFRRQIIKTLIKLKGNGSQVDKIVLKALKENDPFMRSYAIQVLDQINIGKHKMQPILLKALQDPDWDVAEAAIPVLARLSVGSDQIVERLLIALRSQSLQSLGATSSLIRLRKMKSQLLSPFISKLKADDRVVRMNSADALGILSSSEDSEVVLSLMDLLNDKDREVRLRVVVALGRIGMATHHVLEGLNLSMKDEDIYVRVCAASSLVFLNSATPNALKTLIEALKDRNADVQSIALMAFEDARDSLTVATGDLLSLLSDKDFITRHNAMWALAILGNPHPELVKKLLKLLKNDKSETMRLNVVRALGQLKTQDIEVAQGLVMAFNDGNLSMKIATARALSHVEVITDNVVESLSATLSEEYWQDPLFPYLSLVVTETLAKLCARRTSGLTPLLVNQMSSAFRKILDHIRKRGPWAFMFQSSSIYVRTWDALWHATSYLANSY